MKFIDSLTCKLLFILYGVDFLPPWFEMIGAALLLKQGYQGV